MLSSLEQLALLGRSVICLICLRGRLSNAATNGREKPREISCLAWPWIFPIRGLNRGLRMRLEALLGEVLQEEEG